MESLNKQMYSDPWNTLSQIQDIWAQKIMQIFLIWNTKTSRSDPAVAEESAREWMHQSHVDSGELRRGMNASINYALVLTTEDTQLDTKPRILSRIVVVPG